MLERIDRDIQNTSRIQLCILLQSYLSGAYRFRERTSPCDFFRINSARSLGVMSAIYPISRWGVYMVQSLFDFW